MVALLAALTVALTVVNLVWMLVDWKAEMMAACLVWKTVGQMAEMKAEQRVWRKVDEMDEMTAVNLAAYLVWKTVV